MNILYYSNVCPHSKEILECLVKNNKQSQVNFICIDNRVYNPQNNQTVITLGDGKQTVLPPNVDRVPALFLVSDNSYRAVFGRSILSHFGGGGGGGGGDNGGGVGGGGGGDGEPVGASMDNSFSRSNIISEQYTSYQLEPEDLKSDSVSSNRSILPHYVSVNGGGGGDNNNNVSVRGGSSGGIQAPPDTYKSNKVSEKDFSMAEIQKRREQEVNIQQPLVQYKTSL